MLWKGFQKPKRLAADTETLTDKYGRFWAQPFERGFGTTIGNALRRVLLSSIERSIRDAVSEKAGAEHFLGVTVQPMVKLEGYELILGSSIDPQFGPHHPNGIRIEAAALGLWHPDG